MMRRHRFQASDGLTLIGDVSGDPKGKPVLLLHGAGQTRHSWKRGAERLAAAGFRVVAVDARGHGESDWSPDGDYSFPARARDVRAIAAQFPRPPAIVGASMGGQSAILALGDEPRLTAPALVLVDVTPRVDLAGAQRIIDFMVANHDGFASLDEAAEAIARYNPARPRPKSSAGLARNLRQRGGRWFWHWDPRMLPKDIDPLAHAAMVAAAAAKIAIPTLLVRGDRSDVVGEAEIAEFRALMPHARFVDVRGAGHMVAGDHNGAFTDAIVEFLNSNEMVAGRLRPPTGTGD